jgi:nucleoside-diphosphate kinase
MNKNHPKEEMTLVLLKPDALQRNLLGEIVRRFENKGLKVVGLKMLSMDEALVLEHYGKFKDKPFFAGIKKYMTASPIVAIALSGMKAVTVVRTMIGVTKSYEAAPGTIRGDFGMSMGANLVHASDPEEDPSGEVKRFFKPEELFSYQRADFEQVYGEEDRAGE